jgi:TonB family protein
MMISKENISKNNCLDRDLELIIALSLRRILLPFILLFLTITINGQVSDSTIQLIDPVESMPTYPGGTNAMFCFIEKNLRYEITNFSSIKTKYVIRFTIDTIGHTKDFEFIATIPQLDHNSSEDSLIRREIIRVLKLLTNWNPAILGGNIKVSCRYVLQIKVPYTQFICDEVKGYKNVEYNPDVLADFNAVKGATRLDRINYYINTNLRWPSQMDCQGRVAISCIIEKSGKPSNFKFLRHLDPEFDDEAMRLIKEMPKWIPAIKNNKSVRSIVVIPIIFRMD